MRVADRASRAPNRSRRDVLRASAIAGVSVFLAPLGSPAHAALFDENPARTGTTGALRHRVDGLAKVTGQKIFARDIRAWDMPHWPHAQAHALVLRVTKADRLYADFDISTLGTDLRPDCVVTAADLARDGLALPEFYGTDTLLPGGKTPAYLGQAVAILIFHDFTRFRFAKAKLRFNDSVVRYGTVTGPLQRDPWGSSRFVRVGSETPYDDDVFSPMTQGIVFPAFEKHEPAWPQVKGSGNTTSID